MHNFERIFTDQFYLLTDVVKKNIIHLLIPCCFLFISKLNETSYLQPDHESLLPLYFVRILLFLFGYYVSVSINQYISKAIKAPSKQKTVFLATFIWLICWYSFWLLSYYPGSYTTDTIDAVIQLSSLKLNDWYSYFHPLVYLFLYQFYPHPVMIGIAQILLCGWVFSDIISYIYVKLNIQAKWGYFFLAGFIILFSSISSITYYTFFYMRDIPFSVLHLFFLSG